jgi:hypothetical protein
MNIFPFIYITEYTTLLYLSFTHWYTLKCVGHLSVHILLYPWMKVKIFLLNSGCSVYLWKFYGNFDVVILTDLFNSAVCKDLEGGCLALFQGTVLAFV